MLDGATKVKTSEFADYVIQYMDVGVAQAV
jgi:hypothetical protein